MLSNHQRRLTTLETQVVLQVLARARKSTPAQRGAALLHILTTVDQSMATEIMQALSADELESLCADPDPADAAVWEALTVAELEALAAGDPGATARLHTQLQQARDNDTP